MKLAGRKNEVDLRSEDINDMYKSYKSASKTELYCGVMDESRFQGKKGHPLLQEKMKATVKKSRTPSGDAIRKAVDKVTISTKN